MAITKDELRVSVNAFISREANDELNLEGFPDYMTWSFIQAAKNTNTIISSRLPGGAGTDLIEAGYDLKGFQVKAKSCDWGPMGGFICQLPFLNKKGYEKIEYNAGYIAEYLDALNKFSGNKKNITEIQQALNEVSNILSPINQDADDIGNKTLMEKILMAETELTSDLGALNLQYGSAIITDAEHNAILQILGTEKLDIIKIRKEIYKIYNAKIGAIVKGYRTQELNQAKWSGENSIPATMLAPFIPLKRSFAVDTDSVIGKIDNQNGITACTKINDGLLTGIAFNDHSEGTSTVKMEFLLKRDTIANVWSIYHGDIFYRSDLDQWNLYVFATYVIADPIWDALGIGAEKSRVIAGGQPVSEYAKYMNQVFPYLNQIFSRNETAPVKVGEKKYYPLCGIMNPHPPYPENKDSITNPDFYKNAVSGDFDLFAYWPDTKISWNELTRLSEQYLNKNFKLYPNADLLFCIEFIPGFGELTQRSDIQALKESAEVGNISSLGGLVAGMLNNIAMTSYEELHAINIALNKAFHSDEGGRPGILEIEFPIAIFFPKPIKTFALANLYTDPVTKTIPLFTGRTAVGTTGGLIKTPEEFLQVLIDSNNTKNKYQIIMHSEWLIHLFYISMKKADRTDFRGQKGTFIKMFNDLKTTDVNDKPITDQKEFIDQAKMISKKIKEFEAIEKHHLIIYPGDKNADTDFDQPAFELKFKDLLQLNYNTFLLLRMLFLKLAFQSKRKAFERKHDAELIVYNDLYLANTPGIPN